MGPDGSVTVGVALRPDEARAALEAERDRLAALDGVDEHDDDEDEEEDEDDEDEDDGKGR